MRERQDATAGRLRGIYRFVDIAHLTLRVVKQFQSSRRLPGRNAHSLRPMSDDALR